MTRQRRALVTGATGFVGRHLVARLAADGWIVGTAIRGGVGRPTPPEAQATFVLGRAPWDSRTLGSALAEFDPDVVFHLAGRTTAPTAAEMYEANTWLAASLFDTIARAGPCRPAGSAAEYGPIPPARLPVAEDHPCAPVGDYGISKHAQTLMGLARARAGFGVLVARIFNPVGPGMPRHLALAGFAGQLRGPEAGQGSVLHVGDLDVERDFIGVAEAARLISALGAAPENFGEVYNICSGRAFALRPLVEELVRLSGRRVSLVTGPARLRPGEARVFFGSTGRLAARGLAPRVPGFAALLPALLASRADEEKAA
jgi:GDP-4-dehydro-6-deoxy-D-mannose reductase